MFFKLNVAEIVWPTISGIYKNAAYEHLSFKFLTLCFILLKNGQPYFQNLAVYFRLFKKEESSWFLERL